MVWLRVSLHLDVSISVYHEGSEQDPANLKTITVNTKRETVPMYRLRSINFDGTVVVIQESKEKQIIEAETFAAFSMAKRSREARFLSQKST
jgi:hypothetical protein